MNNPFHRPGCPQHPGIQRNQMPGMQRPQMPGMQGHQMPGPQMGQGGAQQMSSVEALRLSGLDAGSRQSMREWIVIMIKAERQGLVERIGHTTYLIRPEFWQALLEEFGWLVGPGGGGGGGGGDQDPFGQDGFDDRQGGFPY